MPEVAAATSGRYLVDLALEVNDRRYTLAVEPRETIADVLRARLSLTGTKVSCDAQVCGTCTVLVEGLPVSGCTFLAVDAEGRRVRTVEGLAAPDGTLSPLQQAFIDHAAFQCGYCTPGFLMAATALLEEEPSPSRERVVEALEGNICRCTGYEQIVEAVLAAAAGGGHGVPAGRREADAGPADAGVAVADAPGRAEGRPDGGTAT